MKLAAIDRIDGGCEQCLYYLITTTVAIRLSHSRFQEHGSRILVNLKFLLGFFFVDKNLVRIVKRVRNSCIVSEVNVECGRLFGNSSSRYRAIVRLEIKLCVEVKPIWRLLM